MDDINRYFVILGLKPGATLEEVKAAYIDLVKVWHPDRFAHDPKFQIKAQEKLKDINEAYQKVQEFLNNFYAYQQATGTDEKTSSKTDESTNTGASQQSKESKQDNSSKQPPKPPRGKHSVYQKDYQEPRPWVRFWARNLDMLLMGFPTGFIFGKILPDFTNQQLATTGGAFVLGLCILPFIVLAEACILAMFGNTPAKAILKTKIINSEGNALSFSEAVQRSFYLYFAGYAMGIPLITLGTYLWQYNRLKKEGKTSWDNKFDFRVNHSLTGGLRIAAYVCLFLISPYIAHHESYKTIATTNNKSEIPTASPPASVPTPSQEPWNDYKSDPTVSPPASAPAPARSSGDVVSQEPVSAPAPMPFSTDEALKQARSTSGEPSWIKYADNDEIVFLYDANNIHFLDKYVFDIWTKAMYRKTQQVNNRSYIQMIDLSRCNCVDRSCLSEQFKITFVEGDSVTQPSQEPKRYFEPTSPGAILLNQICR